MSTYLLSPHVHVCFTTEAAVFLDLRRNKYLGLDASCVAAMRQLIDHTDTDDEHVRQLANSLVAHGLMTTDHDTGRSLCPPTLSIADNALIASDPDLDIDVSPCWRWNHVLNLVASIVIARALWKLFPLRYAVERAADRKARATSTARCADTSVARELVAIFQHLRPYFYAAQSRCLVDAMTLIEFLSRYGVYPDWAFGVKTRPFEAHTWVQQGGLVFNDLPARTNLYTPILVV